MAAPKLTVFQQGLGAVNADNLNTLESTCDNLAQLRAFIGVQGVQVFLRGYVSLNDGGQGPFAWVSNATGPDNGATIIIPTGVSVGAWVRIPLIAFPAPFPSTGLILTWTGVQTNAATWLGGEAAEIAYTIPKDLPGSVGVKPKTRPTADYVVSIQVNTVEVATATFVVADDDWVFAAAADHAVVIGADVDFIGPGDTTVANFGLTIRVTVS